MPMIIAEVPSPGTGTNRNVIDSIVTNVLGTLGLDTETLDIIISTPYSNLTQPHSTVGGKQREVDYGNKPKIYVDVEEQREPEQQDRALGFHNENPIFHDRRRGLCVSGSYVKYNTVITITRKEPSRTLLGGWTNQLLRRIENGMEVYETEITSHWRIPPAALNCINAVYRAGEINLPTYPSLKAYMRQHFSPSVTVATTAIGSEPHFMVRDNIGRIIGTFEAQGVSKQKEGDGGSWETIFTFTFSYVKAEAVTINYPIVVNNVILPKEWWVNDDAPGISDESMTSKSSYIEWQDKLRGQRDYVQLPFYIPNCDRPAINIRDKILNELSLVSGYITFSPDDIQNDTPTWAINLEDFDDNIYLKPATINYLITAMKRDPHGRESLVRITLFENGIMFAREHVAIDELLNVWVQYPIRISAVYTFTISIIVNLSYITDGMYEDLLEHPDFVDGLIDDFRPELRPTYPNITEDPNGIKPEEWLPPKPDGDDTLPTLPPPTVLPDIMDDIIHDLTTKPNGGGSGNGSNGNANDSRYDFYALHVLRAGLIARR